MDDLKSCCANEAAIVYQYRKPMVINSLAHEERFVKHSECFSNDPDSCLLMDAAPPIVFLEAHPGLKNTGL